MKKLFSILLLVCMIITSATFPSSAAEKNVSITLPTFKVTLNGTIVNNNKAQYPLIVYKGITYFPMTYYDSRFLGVETDWDNATGLTVKFTDVKGDYHPASQASQNKSSGVAQIADFAITVNGKKIDNTTEEYPLLNFRDITYFPMTWRFCVTEFGWDYNYTNEKGLVISSGNTSYKTFIDRNSLDHFEIGRTFIEKNSVGGITPVIYYRNNTQKEIKYLYFTLTPYNSVGDKAYSTIGNQSTTTLKLVGPIPSFPMTLSEYEALCEKDIRTGNDLCLINEKYPLGEDVFPYDYDTSRGHNITSTFRPTYFVMSSYNRYELAENDVRNLFRGISSDCVWYNSTIADFTVDSVKIEYMDGTTETIKKPTVLY